MKTFFALISILVLSVAIFTGYLVIGNKGDFNQTGQQLTSIVLGATSMVRKDKEASDSELAVVTIAPDTSESSQAAVIKEKQPTVNVYYHNESRVPKNVDGCGLVFPVERPATWSNTETVEATVSAELSLRQLLLGPTSEEKERGYTSLFSDKTKNGFLGIKIDSETAYVNLKDIRKIIPSASSSCGSAQLLSEIRETLTVNKSIKNVIYAIDGKPKTFYDWIQFGCMEENNNCDPTPFKSM